MPLAAPVMTATLSCSSISLSSGHHAPGERRVVLASPIVLAFHRDHRATLDAARRLIGIAARVAVQITQSHSHVSGKAGSVRSCLITREMPENGFPHALL